MRNKIRLAKKEFADSYGTPYSSGSRPHIALVSFSQYAMMEERVLHRIKTLSMGYHPFRVELRNFGSFPSHSVFIQVATKEPIRGLIREMKTAQQLMKLNRDHKPHFFDEPRLNIATRLQPVQYEKSWAEYSQKSFTGRFVADSMLLLKRRAGDRAYQIAQRLEFMNLPVITRQGELFA